MEPTTTAISTATLIAEATTAEALDTILRSMTSDKDRFTLFEFTHLLGCIHLKRQVLTPGSATTAKRSAQRSHLNNLLQFKILKLHPRPYAFKLLRRATSKQ